MMYMTAFRDEALIVDVINHFTAARARNEFHCLFFDRLDVVVSKPDLAVPKIFLEPVERIEDVDGVAAKRTESLKVVVWHA